MFPIHLLNNDDKIIDLLPEQRKRFYFVHFLNIYYFQNVQILSIF